MAQQATSGVISNVSQRSFPGRNGGPGATLYSFQLEGSNRWFRTGETPIPFGKGQAIQFVVDGQNVDVKTMKAVAATVAASPPPSASAGRPDQARVTANVGTTTPSAHTSAHGAGNRDEYWANKEARDLAKEERFQSVNEPRMALSVATQAAANVVVAALQTEALGFGTVAKGKRLPMLADYVKELATDLAVFINDAPNVLANAKASVSEEAESEETNLDD